MKRSTWTVVGIVCLIGFLNYVDRMVLAAVLPALKHEFLLSDTEVGLLSTGFALVYALAGLPLGQLADRYSRRLIICVATAFWSLMTILCGAAGTYSVVLLARIGVGLGEAAYMPAAFSTLSDLFAPARRHFAHSLVIVSTSIGVIVGLAMGGWLAANYGWRAAFFAFGAPGLLISVLAYFLFWEPRRGATDAAAGAGEAATLLQTLNALRSNSVFIWLCLTNAFNAFCVFGISQWLPSFFERVYQLSLSVIGIVFGIAFGVGLVLGQMMGGVLATRLARRGMFEPMKLCVVSNCLIVIGFVVVLWAPTLSLSIAATLLTTFVGSIGHAAQNTGIQNAVTARQRGVAQASSALLSSAIGMAVGPLIVGIFSDVFATYVGDAEALRYALTIPQVLFIFAAFAAFQAYRHGRRQLDARATEQTILAPVNATS